MLDRGYKRFRISLMNNTSSQGKHQKLTHTQFYIKQYELSKSDVFSVQNKKNTEKYRLSNRYQRRSIEAINSTLYKSNSFYVEPSPEVKALSLKKNKKYIPVNK